MWLKPTITYLKIIGLLALLVPSVAFAEEPHSNCNDLAATVPTVSARSSPSRKSLPLTLIKIFNQAWLAHPFQVLPVQSFFSADTTYSPTRVPTELKDGAFVEGSLEYGGVQPHYKIDLHDPRLKPLLDLALDLRYQDSPPWEKINALRSKVQQLLPGRSYNSISYHLMLRKYRQLGQPIGLGDFIEAKSAVCREHAMLMHFALKAAGFTPLFNYWHTWRRMMGSILFEDHGANVITLDGREVIVDSYFSSYNGQTVNEFSRRSWLNPQDQQGIIGNSEYPRIWLPQAH